MCNVQKIVILKLGFHWSKKCHKFVKGLSKQFGPFLRTQFVRKDENPAVQKQFVREDGNPTVKNNPTFLNTLVMIGGFGGFGGFGCCGEGLEGS